MPKIREKRARLNGPAAVVIAAFATMTIAAPAPAQSGRTACLARHYAVYAGAQRDPTPSRALRLNDAPPGDYFFRW